MKLETVLTQEAVEEVELVLLEFLVLDLQVQIEEDVLSADGHRPTVVVEAEEQEHLEHLPETAQAEVQVRL